MMKKITSRALASSSLALMVQLSTLTQAYAADPAAATGNLAPAIVRFDITRFEVVGNTLLADDLVQATVAPFAGKGRDFGDVQKALEALEAVYHKRGFNVVQVELPEQELNQGVVRLKVVQTKIGKVTVEGNTYFTTENIRRTLPGLVEGQTPNIKQVSASLRMANENPAKKVSLGLESSDQEGQVDAILRTADERPWKVGLNVANTGNESTGKTHLGLLMQHANLFNLDHVGSFQYTTTKEKPSKVAVYGLGYHVPLYSVGDSLDFFASYSDVDSGVINVGVLELAVSGKGKVFGMRYNHNLGRFGDYEPKLSYGFDYKAFINSIDAKGTQLGDDIIVHPISVTYSGTKPLKNGEVNFSLTLVRNIPGGKDGRSSDFRDARTGATASYTLLRFTGNYTRNLPKEWQLRLATNGQITSDALIPGEQFGAGGAASVRGFNEREISNDSGVQVNAELYSPNFCNKFGEVAAQCRLVLFYDAAHVSRNYTQPKEPPRESIGSVGLGWRLLLSKYVSSQIDWGHRVNLGANKKRSTGQLHFRLNISY